MVLINPNTTWNRGGFPYLRDKQHSDKHFLSIQNTIDGVTSKSKHRRSLSYLLSSPVCVYVFDLLTFLWLWHTCFLNVCLHVSVCVPVCACVCVCLCAGLQRLCSCRLFLGGVCFTRYSIFLLLCQSRDWTGCGNWLGEEQERRERWEGWPEGGFSHQGVKGRSGAGRKGMSNVGRKQYIIKSNAHFQEEMRPKKKLNTLLNIDTNQPQH